MFFSNLILSALAVASSTLASPVEIAERQTAQKLRISMFGVHNSHIIPYQAHASCPLPSSPIHIPAQTFPLANPLKSSSPQAPTNPLPPFSAPRRLHNRNHLLARLSLGPARGRQPIQPSIIRRFTELQPAELQAGHFQLGPAPRGAFRLAGRRHRE